jgi:DNA modification methylase
MLTTGRSAVTSESGRAWQVGIHFRARCVFVGEMKVSKLKRNPSNPRQISKDKLEKLKASVGGFQKMMELRPLVVDESFTVLGGNMRLAAIKALGLKDIPDSWIKQASDLTPDEKAQFIITDNSSFGEYDWDEIANSWSDYPLSDWGLDIPDIEAIEPQEPSDAEPQIDKAAELNKKWKVKSGDLWQIGSHRLICGDSTSPQAVERLLDGARPILMVTDPPYGVEYDANWRNEMDRANGKPYGERAIGQVTNDDRVDWNAAYSLFPGDVAYVWHCGRNAREVSQNIEDAGFEIVSQIVWAKSNFAIGRGDYHYKHEPCWYAVRKGKTHNWQGSRSETSLWEIDKPMKSETGHSTQKPLECMTKPIENNTAKGESVYEPFAGSGTTLVACQNLNRKCYAIEISENYCAVILERMQTAFPDIEIKRIEEAQSASMT